MIDLKKLQKEIYQNKVRQKFNLKDVDEEICRIAEELGEFSQAYHRKWPNMAEELADVIITAFGLAEILKLDLGKEVLKKVEKNKKRKYKKVNGVPIRISED